MNYRKVFLSLCVTAAIITPTTTIADVFTEVVWVYRAATGIEVPDNDPEADCLALGDTNPDREYVLVTREEIPNLNYPAECRWKHGDSWISARNYTLRDRTRYCGPDHVFTADRICLAAPKPKVNDGRPCCDSAEDIGNGEGNPVNVATGRKYQMETDYGGTAFGTLNVRRYYNGGPSADGGFEAAWRFSYSRQLKIDDYYSSSSSTSALFKVRAIVVRDDGREIPFITELQDNGDNNYSKPNGVWPGPNWSNWTLTKIDDGYLLTDREGNREYYDEAGRFQAIISYDGLTTTITRPVAGEKVVTDHFGRSLHFRTDAGRVTSVELPDGVTVTYDHDAQGRLTAVHYPGNAVREYRYEDARHPAALTGIVDANGERFATFTYDDTGRSIATEHAGGAERTTIAYLADGSAVATDANGLQRRREFDTRQRRHFARQLSRDCTDCSGETRAVTRDAASRVTSITNHGGITTQLDRNARGFVTSRTEAAGTPEQRTITTDWHPDFRLPTQITEPGRITDYSYDVDGNRLTETVTDTATSETRITTWTYNNVGQVLTVDGPRTGVSDVTTYTYDAMGNLATVTNALGHLTQYTQYDAHGHPLEIVDPNGMVTELEYDLRQRLVSRTVAAGTADAATTTFEYDPAGQLVKTTLPNGAWIAYEYDTAHRLTGIEDQAGNRIDYVLDDLGNRLEETVSAPDGNGGSSVFRETFRDYNQLNQLVEESGPEGTVVTYAEDLEGNRTDTTDAANNTTEYRYDALNRLFETVDALSGVTAYHYDPRDNLAKVIDPRGVTTDYDYNGFNELIETDSPDAGITTYAYDKAGNRISQTDARSITVDYQYDVLNRLTFIDYSGTDQDITYTYDGGTGGCAHCTGRLTRINDETGHTEYSYDARGNLTDKLAVIDTGSNPQSLALGYDHDAADNLAAMSYPSGDVVDYQRDANGRVTGITLTPAGGSAQTLLGNIAYAPFGPVTGKQFGNGISESRNFDPEGRLVRIQSNVLDYSYAWNTVNNITAITDNLDATRTQGFDYDTLYRLTDASGVYGSFEWDYDAVGNREEQVLTPPGSTAETTSYTYAGTSNRLADVTDAGGSTSYLYDAAGNTLDDGDSAFVYDDRNRLVEAQDPNTQATTGTYGHNALGQRVVKTIAGVTTLFAYDETGHLIGEYDDQGNRLREYVWLGDTPIAMVDDTGNLYYIHADHLNTPKVVTDDTQTVVWKGDYTPFGEVDVTVSTVDMPLRFPGQFYDAETGLNYNYFRSYNPAIGRYTQSDPVGLAFDETLYIYALQNPLRMVDPLGLASQCSYWGGVCREKPDAIASGAVGAGGGLHWLLVGTHASSGAIVDTEGKTCAYSLLCAKFGLGITGYVGIEASLGAATQPLKSGTYEMSGGFLEGGLGIFGGVTVIVDGGVGTSLAPQRLSKGLGVAAGYITCSLTLVCPECN